MTVDISELNKAYKRYRERVTNPSLSEDDRRTDLKHMNFWYPYYASTVEVVAEGKKPSVERRTLTKINAQSQIDYDDIASANLLAEIKRAHQTLIKYLPTIPLDTPIPYRQSTSYPPERYAAVVADHLRMHWEYLEKLAKKTSK